ncbi:hypothetical protein GCM10010922_23680 [Microbacterium sorbitolivorans]|uniref:Metal ABC transporter ATP-binding protein n=1 Tax=Microbacterium sorbitolivorans TaxID=1867410 RepID=A0A367XW59_9MICO|nr:zinc ABC transporter ATP-binding protein AztA [Microbacterium sorbitolivorans]RCK57041.1 metal ABC transporter ATP-binding protein [Microbacterium sorbitolivorans]GGF47155.1 hypothetical protein GCM10010922_23680 [Microbacterium sorbitolivorans]
MSVVLSATDLCYSYAGAEVLHGVDAALLPGRVTAIIGPNGAGKSTLIELLAGVREPSRGGVSRAGEVALVVQRPKIPQALPLTVRETVAMGTWGKRRPRREVVSAVEAALDRVGLDHLAERSLHSLSGGQRQRALIAQGIARDAEILLLDEPAAGLDVRSRQRTREILAAEAAAGRAIGWVTHDEEDVDASDDLVHLVDGRRVA